MVHGLLTVHYSVDIHGNLYPNRAAYAFVKESPLSHNQ